MGFALDTGVLHWSGPGRSGWFWTAWLVALHCTTTIRSTLPASGDWTSSSDRMMGPHAKNRKNKIKKKTGATGSIVLIRPPTPDPSLQQPRPRFFFVVSCLRPPPREPPLGWRGRRSEGKESGRAFAASLCFRSACYFWAIFP